MAEQDGHLSSGFMGRRVTLLMVAMLALGACSSNTPKASDRPTTTAATVAEATTSTTVKDVDCSAVFAEGHPVTAGAGSTPCRTSDGDLTLYGATDYSCPDGSTLHYNDLGRWKDGAPFHAGGTTGDAFTTDALDSYCSGG